MIHYFHGLNGNPVGKATILREALGAPIDTPTYNNEDEYFAAIEGAISAAESRPNERPVFIGNSLGGFAAYCTARRTGGVAMIVNPCLRPWLSLKRLLNDDGSNAVTDSWLLRTRELFESLGTRQAERVVAFTNLDDELLAPFEEALAAAGITDLRTFPLGGHRATNFASEIVPAIRSEIRSGCFDFVPSGKMKFRVAVDSNSRFMDEEERYHLPEFATLAEAIAACKEVVDGFLTCNHQPGQAAEGLFSSYKMFGEDPWIATGDGKLHFSAWDYAERRCAEICGSGGQ